MEEDILPRFRAAYWTLVHNVDTLRLHVWEERGITLPQLRILFYLRAHPNSTTNKLAKLLGLTAPTMSGLIDKLVRAGLVERKQHPDDRRLLPIALTAEGEEIVGEIKQGNQSYLIGLAEEIGDELEPITIVLERLVAAIKKHPAVATRKDEATHEFE
jgi:MarR family transcriptional regulator, organic hydroperoxide resistance regulator